MRPTYADARPAVVGEDGGAGRSEDRAFASAPVPSQTMLALQDLVEGARAFHLWGLLGWQDIRLRYRRSTLGPFWLTISMGAMVGGLGLLYGGLFKLEPADYLPFLAAGFLLWGLLSGLVEEGCATFTSAEGIIKQVNLPLSVHMFRAAFRNLVIFGHNAVVYVATAVLFAVQPGWAGLLVLPGLVLFCLNGLWMGLLVAIVSARFRDVAQIVATVMRFSFFLTPIIWKPELMSNRASFLDESILYFNPFFHLIELVRGPMLGQTPGLVSWLAALGMALGGWLVTLLMYRRYRRRIAYWV